MVQSSPAASANVKNARLTSDRAGSAKEMLLNYLADDLHAPLAR